MLDGASEDRPSSLASRREVHRPLGDHRADGRGVVTLDGARELREPSVCELAVARLARREAHAAQRSADGVRRHEHERNGHDQEPGPERRPRSAALAPDEQQRRHDENRTEDRGEAASHPTASGVVAHVLLHEHGRDEETLDYEQNPTDDDGELHGDRAER